MSKDLTVKELIARLEKLPQDLPIKHYSRQGRPTAVKDCRLILADHIVGNGEESYQPPEFVCLY